MSDTPTTSEPRTTIDLTEFSTESLECFEQYGINAAERLNQYSMSLEDALVEAVNKNKDLNQQNGRLRKEIKDLEDKLKAYENPS